MKESAKSYALQSLFGLAWLALLAMAPLVHAQTPWAPSKPVELIVPAGTGGGADQMARFLQSVIAKHRLMMPSMTVVNKPGDAGAEGFLYLKNSPGDAHKIIITLSNLFTTPLATGAAFNWKDLTPVSMLALDEFVLWVHAESPVKTAGDFVRILKNAQPGQYKMGGTGVRQEDEILTAAIEKVVGKKMTYQPYKGGGDVAVQLVMRRVDATVNNPIEAVTHWKSGSLRPVCVFDSAPMPYPRAVTSTQSWRDLPTCKSQGLEVEYLMLRGIFMAPGVTPEQLQFYVDLFGKVRELPEWKQFMEDGAFRNTALVGQGFHDWLTKAQSDHDRLMNEAGFVASRQAASPATQDNRLLKLDKLKSGGWLWNWNSKGNQ
jgi:putative tricarboxylic transport membrane protein